MLVSGCGGGMETLTENNSLHAQHSGEGQLATQEVAYDLWKWRMTSGLCFAGF